MQTTAPKLGHNPGWIHGPIADLLTLVGPWLFAAAMLGLGGAELSETRVSVWIVQFVFGNTTHVILTFLLLAFRQDVLKPTPAQLKIVSLGSTLVFGLSWALFRGVEMWAPRWSGFLVVVAAVFGAHHRLSQGKGVWSLYNLRASKLGLAPPSNLERTLQQVWVSLGLILLMISWMFVPSAPGRMFPVFPISADVPALFPYEVDFALAGVWVVFSAILLVSVGRASPRNVPKLVHIGSHAAAITLGIVVPVWGMIIWGSIHGLEYYFLCARMMKARDGDSFAPVGSTLARPIVIWGLMFLAMAPLIAVGLAHAPFANVFTSSPRFGHEGMVILNSIVLAHYFADAFIYRFRIPEVRAVALRRMGYQLCLRGGASRARS